MSSAPKTESFVTFVGDVLFFIFALWVALFLRMLHAPNWKLFHTHIVPFSFLFIVWVAVFFIAGLYERRSIVFQERLSITLLYAQIANSIIAVGFFYFIPYFGITPKTVLFIYLVVSSLFVIIWRIFLKRFIVSRRKQAAILIASGKEAEALFSEINASNRHHFFLTQYIDIGSTDSVTVKRTLEKKRPEYVIIDMQHKNSEPLLPELYELLFSHTNFIDMQDVYESTFNRIPLSLVRHSWFLENVSTGPQFIYDILKRALDMVIAVIAGIISLAVYPFVYVAIKLDDGGEMFITQDRIGQWGKVIRIYKFRSMSGNDSGKYGSSGKTNLVITRVGAFLRVSRIDELPQLWNVFRGDLSLIGPRPELPSIVETYDREIPYYNVRHLIKPGLSGWAQIYHENHPHHGSGHEMIEQTKEKLSYDLFYIKNRSVILDAVIILKTIRALILRTGR